MVGEEDGARGRAEAAIRDAVGDARCELADTPEVRAQVARLGGSGQGLLIDWLERRDPVARAERAEAIAAARRMDHVCLIRYDGTDVVQWHGRRTSGFFNPFGRPMRIVGAPAS